MQDSRKRVLFIKMAVPKISYAIGNAASTTLAVAASNSDTSMTITSDTNFAAKSGEGMILIDESQATEEIIYSASKAGATLSTPSANRGLEGGSAQAHAISASVKGILTEGMWNDLCDALIDNLLDQTTGEVKSGVVLTLPQINDTSSDHQYVVAVSELASDRTVTLPLLGAADTFVFQAHTQEISNKTHDGDFALKNATDNIIVNSVDPWRTIDVFGGMQPTTTAGCSAKTQVEAGTNDIDYDVLDFATGSDENAYVNFRMPDSWDAGVVQFRYIWTNAAGLTTETVTFELSGIAYADDDPIDAAVGTAIEVADTWIAQGDIHTSAWSGDVTLSGTPAAGEYVHFEIMRDVSEDDLTGDARLMNVQIRYKQAQFSD